MGGRGQEHRIMSMSVSMSVSMSLSMSNCRLSFHHCIYHPY